MTGIEGQNYFSAGRESVKAELTKKRLREIAKAVLYAYEVDMRYDTAGCIYLHPRGVDRAVEALKKELLGGR